jgi:hypothetical protein
MVVNKRTIAAVYRSRPNIHNTSSSNSIIRGKNTTNKIQKFPSQIGIRWLTHTTTMTTASAIEKRTILKQIITEFF